MRVWRRFFTRFVHFATRHYDDQRLLEEVEDHLARQTEENLRLGMTAAEARRQAVIQFGAVEAIRERYHAEQGFPLIANLLQDLKFGLRLLWRAPGFSIVAILVLALGISALATVATWTNAVLYSPWPHVVASRDIRFIDATVMGNDGYSVNYDQYRFLRDSGHSWVDTVAFAETSLNLAGPGERPDRIPAGVVSSNYFQFLGITPQQGRFFQVTREERHYGANNEIVLSNSLWRDRFQGDQNIVGRAIRIGERSFTVVGIAPKDFAGIFGGIAEAAWIPLPSLRDLSGDAGPDPLQHYGLQVAVRLPSGIKDATAMAEAHSLARSYALHSPDQNLDQWDLNIRDAAHFSRGLFHTVAAQLPILLGASTLLLVLVCINIGSLLGQRAMKRRREVAIRTALGATAGRIAMQALTETGLLAVAGGFVGWGSSIGIARLLYRILPNGGAPLAFNLRPDVHILFLVTGVTVVVTLVCGLYPLRQALRSSQQEALHESSLAVTGSAHRRLGRQFLLGMQLGICFIVLVGCSLLLRTAFNIATRDIGFDRHNCLTAQLVLSRAGYTGQRGLALQDELLHKVSALPGVASATLTSHLPMGDDGTGNTQDFSIPGYTPSKGEEMSVVTDFEGPDFFHVMGIPIREGREFTSYDDASSMDVAMVNESMARRYWPNGNAVGNRVVVNNRSRQIIGVVRNYVYSDPSSTESIPVLFLPLAQNYYSRAIIAIHSKNSTAANLASQLRQTVESLDRSVSLQDVRTFEQVTDQRYQTSRIPAEMLFVYALSSVLVAMIGLYAVAAYSVMERHREFALRIALGSKRSAIFHLVIGDGIRTAAIGLLVGGLGSVGATRLLRSMLFGMTTSDSISYFAAALFLLLIVFLSGLAPAWRAASTEPIRILRAE